MSFREFEIKKKPLFTSLKRANKALSKEHVDSVFYHRPKEGGNVIVLLLQFMTEAERKETLRRAILNRAPNLSSRLLDRICNSVNTQRRYFIKHTTSEQKFLNLATQETIVTKDNRVFCVVLVLPIYGDFTCPYFERIGESRSSREGTINLSPCSCGQGKNRI